MQNIVMRLIMFLALLGGIAAQWVMPQRAMAAVFTVTIASDTPDASPDDDACDTDTDAPGLQCSLRAAVQTADAVAGADMINFNLPGDRDQINLESALILDSDITINGSGTNLLSLDGGHSNRIFEIRPRAIVTINNLTIQNGWSSEDGGAVANSGRLTLDNVVISSSSTAKSGGGIFNRGTLTVNNSSILGNSAELGGGLLNFAGTTSINQTLFSLNRASLVGAAIFNGSGELTIQNSSIIDNAASGSDNHVYAVVGWSSGGSITIENSTISRNPIGGIYASVGAGITIYNSTIAYNTLEDNPQSAPNLSMLGDNLDPGVINVYNSIIAGLVTSSGAQINCNAVTIQPNSLSTDRSCGGTTVTVEALALEALSDRHGITPVHPLLPGSVAINAGDNTAIPDGISTDQIGQPRIVSSRVDVGAYESQSEVSTDFVVDRADDLDVDGCTPAPDDCTLRGAIGLADANGEALDTISFDPNLFVSGPRTITAASEIYTQTSDLMIAGPGADKLTISGGGTTRPVRIVSGTRVTISGVTFDNGRSFYGGGINNDGDTTIENSVFTGNVGTVAGGAIHNGVNGVLRVVNSTIAGNNSAPEGGAIDNLGILTVENSTITGNRAQNGAAIDSTNTLTLVNSTLNGNDGIVNIGGVYASGTVTVYNTIIANSTGTGNCYFNGIVTASHNLSTDATCGTGFTQVTSTQLNLGVLTMNGGATPTHALLTGSYAVNGGDNARISGLMTDQRGYSRVIGGIVDIGAFEAQD